MEAGTDTRVGSEGVYELSNAYSKRLLHLTRVARITPPVASTLNRVLAASHETAAWLAYDSGRYDAARYHWLDAMHVADVHRFGEVRPRAMAGMSLHATYRGWAGEAVQLAQTAARQQDLTPRVRSLLAAREAVGHAAAGDAAAADHALALSMRLLEAGSHADDPPWIAFWGPEDFACHRSIAAASLGNLPVAERTGRVALDQARATGYRRNEVLYGVRVAMILARSRAVDEAIALARPAVTTHIESHRIRTDLRATVRLIGDHKTYRPAREFAAWANRLMGAA